MSIFSSPTLSAATALSCGGLANGTLAPGQVDQYMYTGQANGIITLTLARTGSWDLYYVGPSLTLYDPSGKALLSLNFNSQKEVTLALTGTYLVQVYSSNPTYGGSYSVSLQCLDPAQPATALSCGGLANGTLAPAQVDQYTFSGQVNGVITLNLAKTGSWDLYYVGPSLTLYDPSGKALLSLNFNSQQEVTLALTGTYVVQVYSSNLTYGGGYSVSLQCVNPAQPATALSCGGLANGTLAPAQVDQYTFSGQVNGVITLNLAKTGSWDLYYVGPSLTLYDPSGKALLSLNFNSQQKVTLAWTGTYVVQVYSSNLTYGGGYSFAFNCISGMSGEGFVPIPPCRVVDTRSSSGFTGAFGPPSMTAGSTRAFPIPTSSCGIPSTAQAYSFNVTAVPPAPLTYLSIWPTGELQPLVSTLNSFDGQIVANAAIVPAGSSGSVSVYVSDNTDVLIDIDGYFIPASSSPAAEAFYTDTPCRIADTRASAGFPDPFGPPSIAGGSTREFPILMSKPPLGCTIDKTAQAYSLNLTVVPQGTLDYISLWPDGEPQPVVSTINSLNGRVVANAALVPAGPPPNGGVDVYASDNTDVIIDIDGHFAPPGAIGALNFHPVSPCRIADTRSASGFSSPFGPPSMAGGSVRDFPIPSSSCGIPSSAQAYSVNMTVVPPGIMQYLTTWPTGQSQPVVSTLNSYSGTVVANAAIVPAGTSGSISVFVTDNTDVIIDINGYFAP